MRPRDSVYPIPPAKSSMQGVVQSPLYNGSKFNGHQKSKGNTCTVEVTLKHVDLENSYLCGYLSICGLTDEHRVLITYFDGEIISEKFPFLTRKWEAEEEVDKKHWSQFSSFSPFLSKFNADDFDYNELKDSDFLYMRWKEQFWVPDHTKKDVNGASFAGFYYICLQKSTNVIEGYYFHRNSEMYQSLTLKHVPQYCTGVYEFR